MGAKENPLVFFRPEYEEDDDGTIGRMIGWRPINPES